MAFCFVLFCRKMNKCFKIMFFVFLTRFKFSSAKNQSQSKFRQHCCLLIRENYPKFPDFEARFNIRFNQTECEILDKNAEFSNDSNHNFLQFGNLNFFFWQQKYDHFSTYFNLLKQHVNCWNKNKFTRIKLEFYWRPFTTKH